MKEKLILGFYSLPQAGPAERAGAAAAGGFTGISLSWAELTARREAGEDAVAATAAELRAAGIDAPQMEIITLPPRGAVAAFEAHAREVAAVSRALGCEVVCSVARDRSFSPLDYAEGFALLADACADEGLACVVEFVPHITAVETPADALSLVRAVGRLNAGITVDSLHFHRSGRRWSDFDGLRGEDVRVIQLNDGPLAPETLDYHAECMGLRRPPGDGEFELERLLDVLAAAGVAIPLTVEVMSRRLAALPVEDAARRLGEAGRRINQGWLGRSKPAVAPG